MTLNSNGVSLPPSLRRYRRGGGARVQLRFGPFIEEDCHLLVNLWCAKRAFFSDNKRVVRQDKHSISLYSSRITADGFIHAFFHVSFVEEKGRQEE